MKHDAGYILLVEDEPNDVELIQMALEAIQPSIHIQMDIVSDGEQALSYLFGGKERILPHPLPNLILLDLKLPKVSGLRVLQEIRSDLRTRHLVVVIMTSSQEDSDLKSCYDLGINSYVVKPVDFQQFLEVARTVGLYWLAINKPPVLING